MLLLAETLIILILVASLIILLIEEDKIKKSKIPRGKVKEYWNGKERRKSRRINASLIVKYSVTKKPRSTSNGYTKDISNGGMRLLLNEKLCEGVLLLLEFQLPGFKNAVCAEGKVAWADGNFNERDGIGKRIFQTGIQFLNIKPDDKNRLAAYIEKISEAA